jgi:hypothetical protein
MGTLNGSLIFDSNVIHTMRYSLDSNDVRRYNRTRVSLCILRKQPFQHTRVKWSDFPLIPNSIISHQVNKQKSKGRSVMSRGLRTTRQTQQHLCQIEAQPILLYMICLLCYAPMKFDCKLNKL